jgi:hypothetical protein
VQIKIIKPVFAIKYNQLFLTVIFITILLGGCTSLTALIHLKVQGVVIENRSTTTVSEVRVSVKETGGFAYCSHVYSQAECSTRFQTKRYQGNPLTVSWIQDGSRRTYEDLNATLPESINTEIPATLRIIIDRAGNASASLKQ